MKWFSIASVIFISVSLASCVSNRVYTLPDSECLEVPGQPDICTSAATGDLDRTYRRSVRTCAGWVPPSDSDLREPCHLAIIEFDELGEMWRYDQLDDTLDLLNEASNSERSALVVVFVHGWKNNASKKNEERRNLKEFQEILIELTKQEHHRWEDFLGQDSKRPQRPVVGIYMAWRGQALSSTFLENLMLRFFSRRRAAERVGRVSFSHAIHRIVAHAKGVPEATIKIKGSLTWETQERSVDRGNQNSLVVVIGHSLGAVILENTLLRSLTAETNNFRESFPVDLAVMVNSANEAILTRQFLQALSGAPPAYAPGEKQARCAASPENGGDHILPQADASNLPPYSLPLILAVTSEGDWATGKLKQASQVPRYRNFRRYEGQMIKEPKGTAQGSSVPHHEPKKQRYYFRHTAAKTSGDAGILSHEMSTEQIRDHDFRDWEERDPHLFDPPAVETRECLRDQELWRCLRCIERIWYAGPSGQTWEVKRLKESPNRTPYWVMRLPKEIVVDHSHIFQPEFVTLLAALVNLPRAPEVADPEEARRYLACIDNDDCRECLHLLEAPWTSEWEECLGGAQPAAR